MPREEHGVEFPACLVLKEEKEHPAKKDWLLFLAYIGAKRTHEQAFQRLRDKIRDEQHEFSSELSKLEALYDFTPIRPAE